jgi:uncharacterized protein YndB with AHSA1/START domain
MPTTTFHLTTHWTLPAPPLAVFAALVQPEEWPSWWRAVEKVEMLDRGGADGIGAYSRFTWRTALPYAITFNMRVTRVVPVSLIEGRADGELDGTGRWTLTPATGGTQVQYDWIVEVTKPWMRTLAPVLRPVFAWNHDKVMQWGHEGLQRRLKS